MSGDKTIGSKLYDGLAVVGSVLSDINVVILGFVGIVFIYLFFIGNKKTDDKDDNTGTFLLMLFGLFFIILGVVQCYVANKYKLIAVIVAVLTVIYIAISIIGGIFSLGSKSPTITEKSSLPNSFNLAFSMP